MIDSAHAVCRRIAYNIEPAPAAGGMQPSFEMLAPRVDPFTEIAAPCQVIDLFRGARPNDVALSSTTIFDFVPWTAPGAGDLQHDISSVCDAGAGRLVYEGTGSETFE
jgi:hypothetical protein